MCKENMAIYTQVAQVPAEAQKTISAGRLKGFTDINPMWRIKKLTEVFGACGFGWYTEILERWLENSGNGEITAHVTIALYVKRGDEWSKPIIGTGGSSFVAKQRDGFYTSDECYKMAYTDAISVACKALGMGADIYYANDRTKYSQYAPAPATQPAPAPRKKITEAAIDLKADALCEYYYGKYRQDPDSFELRKSILETYDIDDTTFERFKAIWLNYINDKEL